MKTPVQILEHEPKFSPDAWKDYTAEELGWWVHLLRKRAGMRTEPSKRDKDLLDADNYEAMLKEMEARP